MKDMAPIFITGIGTGIGKTIVSAIITRSLNAGYWKPIQAGTAGETDSECVRRLLTGTDCNVYPETYSLAMAASPHISAREEGLRIDVETIARELPGAGGHLVIEGAGGLMVPLNDDEFMIDLIEKLNAKVILVSRNYLGSINHSLLTAAAGRMRNLNIIGWVFNDQFLDYEEEIAIWSGFPKIASVPYCEEPDDRFIKTQAALLQQTLQAYV
jgi:dethiobiotin synthetase